MANNAVQQIQVTRINDGDSQDIFDAIAIEEPLEIRLEHSKAAERKVQNISVTMRTPGNDAELATGFLFTEGIIKNAADIADAGHCFIPCAENRENVIQVTLGENVTPNLQKHRAQFLYHVKLWCVRQGFNKRYKNG